MKQKAFTLIEMIMVIVILGILSAGTFISLKHLYTRVAKSKALAELSLESQIIVDQISSLLYDRVPSSVIGYDGVSGFESIYDLNADYDILEWMGVSVESHQKKDYSGFVDLDDSNATSLSIVSPDTDVLNMQDTIQKKFNITNNIYNDNIVSLVFSGTLDDGTVVFSSDFNASFGWHGNSANKMYDISPTSNGKNIILESKPDEVYEKYYIVDSAYAIARGEHVDTSTCTGFDKSVGDDTLLMFYDYRPWKGETFCGDKGSSGVRAGKVTILSNEVSGFEIGLLNNNIVFSLSMQRGVPRGKDSNLVTISKQKVVF